MKELHTPLFSNSCGKIFANSIVLASANHETSLMPQSIKKLTFNKNITRGSFFFILLPCLFFVLPSFIAKDEAFVTALFYMIGAVMLATAVFKAEKAFTLTVYMKDGTARTKAVWEGNAKEAQHFVTKANELIYSKLQAEPVGSTLVSGGVLITN